MIDKNRHNGRVGLDYVIRSSICVHLRHLRIVMCFNKNLLEAAHAFGNVEVGLNNFQSRLSQPVAQVRRINQLRNAVRQRLRRKLSTRTNASRA